jgi:hypothetical protein
VPEAAVGTLSVESSVESARSPKRPRRPNGVQIVIA